MKGRFARVFSFLGTTVPTFLVFAAIAGLALWGHRTGWKAPKLSDLRHTNAAAQEDWCKTHNVPDSKCLACHPELVGANPADWCKEHGVPESRCTICHPEILTKGVASDWCPEHGVPESNCTICHPEIAMKGKLPPDGEGVEVKIDASAVTTQPSTTAPTAPTASSPEPKDPTTAPSTVVAAKPGKNPQTCQTHAMKVQFASPESVRKAGVRFGRVQERPMTATVTANAEVVYNQNRVARVAPRVAGTVWRVDREVGQTVKKGDLLALVDAAEVGKAKSEVLQAEAQVEVRGKTLERIKASAGSGFRTEAELQEAEAALREANIRVLNARQAMLNLGLTVTGDELAKVNERSLVFLGLPEPVVRSIDPGTTTASLMPVFAPLDGMVIVRDAVAGEMSDPTKPIFVVADISTMWVVADVAQEDARRLAVGQDVVFRPNDNGDDPVSGSLAWMSTGVDERTRTLRVRAEVGNTDGRLLAHTFGKARITFRRTEKAVVVPDEAVQWEGCCHIVFVRLTDDIFQPRKVKLGVRQAGFTEVLIGVLPGEVVTTAGSHVLKSEVLRGNLGAGCTDD